MGVPPAAPTGTSAAPAGPERYSESEWLRLHPGAVKVMNPNLYCSLTLSCSPAAPVRLQLTVSLPFEPGSDILTGKEVELNFTSLSVTVGDVKTALSDVLDGMPPARQQLRNDKGFLKDTYSLAFYNILPEYVLLSFPTWHWHCLTCVCVI